jgi:hypothetical protein
LYILDGTPRCRKVGQGDETLIPNDEVSVIPRSVPPQDEPDRVKRLRASGFDVRGGEGNLPEEPEASFAPMPEKRFARMVHATFNWFRSL